MPLHRQTHSASSLSDTNSSGSTPSRSSSSERSSHPTVQQPPRTHHHHLSVSAPPSFANRTQSDGLTSESSSRSSSTLVSSDEKAPSNPSFATKTAAATLSPETKKMAKSRSSARQHDQLKGERSCLDLDWSYRNVYASASSHGRRKVIGGGSGSVGTCALM